MADHSQGTSRKGFGGTLKLLAIIALTIIGIFAILLIADVIPREVFNEAMVKGLSIIGVVAGVAIGIALIARK